MNLGNALETLGERESGTGKLEEAVAAYREALKERTRERVPLDWAMTPRSSLISCWRPAFGEFARRLMRLPDRRQALLPMAGCRSRRRGFGNGGHREADRERHLVTREIYKQRCSAALGEWRAPQPSPHFFEGQNATGGWHFDAASLV